MLSLFEFDPGPADEFPKVLAVLAVGTCAIIYLVYQARLRGRGAPRIKMVICPRCGHQFDIPSEYCPNCDDTD